MKNVKYKKRFFQLNKDTIVLLSIFEQCGPKCMQDYFIKQDLIGEGETLMDSYNLLEQAAKDFIECLEGNECELFIKALKSECENYLLECEKRKAKLIKLEK